MSIMTNDFDFNVIQFLCGIRVDDSKTYFWLNQCVHRIPDDDEVWHVSPVSVYGTTKRVPYESVG